MRPVALTTGSSAYGQRSACSTSRGIFIVACTPPGPERARVAGQLGAPPGGAQVRLLPRCWAPPSHRHGEVLLVYLYSDTV
jgi:hypothetical protein